MLSVHCLSVCLSVTFVHCGQTVGRIKMKLGMQVGFGRGHYVLDGDPAPLPKGGRSPQFLAHICCSQMAGWIKMPLGMEVGLSPCDFVLDGDLGLPSRKMGAKPPSPIFGPFPLWSNGCNIAACIEMPLGMEVGLSPRDFVLDGNPASLNFRPMFIIVIVISLEHCTKHSRYWFIQVQVLYSMHSIFRKV